MRKLLKIIGILILLIIGVIAAFVLYFTFRPATPENYYKTTETGGAIEARYLAKGPYKVSSHTIDADEPIKQYTVYYPADLKQESRTYPAVIMVNGTGIPASKYKAVFKHLASWGFIVIGNEDPSSGNGQSTEQTLMYLLSENENSSSVLFHKIDTYSIGLEGHSQGGAGVFCAMTLTEHRDIYKTGVALSPTHEDTAVLLGWPYTLNTIDAPVLMLAGTEGDFETQMVLPIEAMNRMYDKLPADKAMARRIGKEHGQMLYSADGYATAWLMWQLQGDEQAAEAFIGQAPELLANKLYQDQRIDIGG